MDFVNLAKQGYSAYQASQHHDNSNSNDSNNNSGPQRPQFDHDAVVNQAQQQHGSGEASLYSNAMAHVNNNQDAHNDPINEDDAHKAHDQAYNQDAGSNLSANGMGAAAAMQAFESFASGGGNVNGGSKSKLMSLAMSEASKLFDKSGGAASGNKQDVINSAAMTVMKLLVQSGGASSFIGGGNSGGLMSLASKFM